MCATRGSSKFSTATPEGGSAVTSSLLARATPSRSPKYSTWAMATLVTMPTSGRPTWARRATCPTPRAPISRTTHWASSGALRSVSGTPSSLLKDRSLADTPKVETRHWRRRSFVVVLPTEPVMPITPPCTCSRATTPSCMSAAAVSATTMAVAPTGFLCRQVGRGSPFQGGADELVPVAFGDDGNVELARRCRPGVDGHSIDDDVGSDLLPTEAGGEFRNGESHASPSRLIV